MDYSEFEEEIAQLQKFLIEKGALELHGMTQEGDITFKMNMEVLKEVFPPLYEQIMQDIDDTMLDLYQEGLVEVSYDENLDASFGVSDKAYEKLREMGYDIPNFYEEDEI